jgi:hypothetical protein
MGLWTVDSRSNEAVSDPQGREARLTSLWLRQENRRRPRPESSQLLTGNYVGYAELPRQVGVRSARRPEKTTTLRKGTMRSSELAGFAALALLVIAPAHAVPVTWNMEGTFTQTNLPALGPIVAGDTMSASISFDTDSPGVSVGYADGYVFWNVFDAFTVNVNGHTLTLGPELGGPNPGSGTNSLATANFPDYQVMQWTTLFYEGDTPYYAETWFEFSDVNAFPIGSLPLTPPSLASATLAEFRLYSPVPDNGGYLFIGSANIGSLTSASVPEPSTLALALTAAGMLVIARRRRVQAAA